MGMPDTSAEDAARAHAKAVVSNDIGAVVGSMTPDGFARAMNVGNTSWAYTGFELQEHAVDGEDHIFDIRYATDAGAFTLRNRFRSIDGSWKVVDVEQIDQS